MKYRIGLVSNSSSSSFTCRIDIDRFSEFEKDIAALIDFINDRFGTHYEFEYSVVERKSSYELVKEYLLEHENIKNPSQKMIDLWDKELAKYNYFLDDDKYVEIIYTIDTETNDCYLANVCQAFIENYYGFVTK